MVKGYKGFLITFEGGEGSGKGTIINLISKKLKEKGIDVVSTREPGGNKISEKIRRIILDPEHKEMSIRAELLLYEASRAQHTEEVIIPDLKQGKLILCNRYFDSSTIYQGVVRGNALSDVYFLNRFATFGIVPDLTILLNVDPKIGLQRCTKDDFQSLDRLETAGLAFHKRVNQSYLELAKKESNRIKVIDSNKSLSEVCKEIMEKYIIPFCKNHSLI